MRLLAFDVGGSKISSAIIEDGSYSNLKQSVVVTPSTADAIAEIFCREYEHHHPDGVALATAGIVYNNKLSGKPNNLPAGYENIDFGDLFHVPYLVENDANAAAWAEYKAGVLKNTNNGLMLTLGTDVGCSIIINGQLVRGKCGAAGEIRMPFSGTSLKKAATEARLSQTDCFAIKNLALSGDSVAREVYRTWEENLLNGLRELNQLLDTEVVALSGSLSKIVDYAKINTALKILCPHNAPLVRPANFSTEAGVIGAAFLWMDKFKE